MKPIVHHDLTNSVQDFRLLDDYEAALRDLLYFYDKVRGTGHGEGWTAAEVLRLEQIRKMAPPVLIRVPERDPRAMEGRRRANGSAKPPKPRKTPSKLRASRNPRQRRSPGLSFEG